MSWTIPYPNTLSRTVLILILCRAIPYLDTLNRILSEIDNSSRQPIRLKFYVTRQLWAKAGDHFRLSARVRWLQSVLIHRVFNSPLLLCSLSYYYANENWHYPELSSEPLRLELNFTFPLEHVSGFFLLGERMSSVAADKFGVVEKKPVKDKVSLQQIINLILLLKFRYPGSIPSDSVPTLDNDSFAITNRQPRKMQGEQWTMYANPRQQFFFADSLAGRKYSFSKHQYNQTIPELLEVRSSLSRFHMIDAAFSLSFNKRKLPEFTTKLYFNLWVITCHISIFSM